MSDQPRSILIRNIGTIATGDIGHPLAEADSISIEAGVIRRLSTSLDSDAEIVIDARGTTLIPGLVDSHSHPSLGPFTPAQDTQSWIPNYVHGGVTSMISAGELHLPGLKLPPDPSTAVTLALLAKTTWDHLRVLGAKVFGGTLLLVPGLREKDFDAIAEAGIRLAKFIFYDYSMLPDGEALEYVRWAHARGVKIKLHSGGVSRSGVSQVAGWEVIQTLQPDIVAHINGGPIPMSDQDLRKVIHESSAFCELCTSGNAKVALAIIEALVELQREDRLLLGTDTPGGTGVIPRGMLRQICFTSALGGIEPERAIAMASGNVGEAHGLRIGKIQEGWPADVVILDSIEGSRAGNALDSFAIGDLPGISVVITDGRIRVWGRSEQTPPASRPAVIVEAL